MNSVASLKSNRSNLPVTIAPNMATQTAKIDGAPTGFNEETHKVASMLEVPTFYPYARFFQYRFTTAELLGAYGFRGNLIWIVCRFCFDRFPSRASEIAPAPNTNPSVSRFDASD